MATVIQIKRSANAAAPSTAILSEGELAYSQDASNDGASAKLFIEAIDSGLNPVIHAIGGKFYTDLLDAASSTDTANAIVQRDSLANFEANTITANTFIGAFEGAVTGEASSANIASFANALTTPIFINLTGDVSGSVQTDLTGNIDISSTVIGANAVALGEDTTGQYVGNVVQGTGIEITGHSEENAELTVNLTDTTVTIGTYGGSTNIPYFSVNQQGRITEAGNTAISTDLSVAADSGSDTVSLINETLQFTGNTGISTAAAGNTVYIINDGVTSISGTANEVDVSAGTGAVTVGLPDNVIVGNDLTVSGNLTVNGTAITVNSETLSIVDPIIHLASNNFTTDTVDIGFEGHYFDALGGNVHAGLVRDATDGNFKLFSNIQHEATDTIDFTDPGYVVSTLIANLEGGAIANLTAAIGVEDGGTGKTTVTNNAVLYGQGTGALAEATGTAGQVLQLNDSGVPIFGGVDGGSY